MSNYDKEYAIGFNIKFYKYDTETGEEVENKDGSTASYTTKNIDVLNALQYLREDLDVDDFEKEAPTFVDMINSGIMSGKAWRNM